MREVPNARGRGEVTGAALGRRGKDQLARLRGFRYATGMNTFVKAVVSGFAFTLGATLFRKLAKKVGLEEEPVPVKAPAQSVGGEPAAETT